MASKTVSPTAPEVDRAESLRAQAFVAKRAWHAEQAALSPREKVAILLRLQREILPILRSRRPLAPHERPWPIQP
jgi:hypothetical protein